MVGIPYKISPKYKIGGQTMVKLHLHWFDMFEKKVFYIDVGRVIYVFKTVFETCRNPRVIRLYLGRIMFLDYIKKWEEL